MPRPSTRAREGDAGWVEYWSRDDFWRDADLWRVNAELFFRAAGGFLGFTGSDKVLDVGCGPGHLEPLLAPYVREIVAADVAEQYLALCRRRCAGIGNVRTALLGPAYTDLSVLGRDFTRVLCISVVQYYRDLKEVEALIDSARRIVRPGALMLIADLPLRRGAAGAIWDGACSLLRGVRGGYGGALLRTAAALQAGGTRYRRCREEHGQLAFRIDELESLVGQMGLEVSVVRRSLSVCANRPSLLIRF